MCGVSWAQDCGALNRGPSATPAQPFWSSTATRAWITPSLAHSLRARFYFFLRHAATASLYGALLTVDTAQTILQFLGDSRILPLRVTKEVFSLALEQLIPELPEVISSARTRYERERGNVLAQASGGEEWLEERDNTEVEEILIDIHEDAAITAPDPGEILPGATTTDARLAWCRYVDNRYRARVRARGILTTHREAHTREPWRPLRIS